MVFWILVVLMAVAVHKVRTDVSPRGVSPNLFFAAFGVALTAFPLFAQADEAKVPTREEARARLEQLVAKFERDKAHYTSVDFLEKETRQHFIDGFFEAFGWDVVNLRKLPLFRQDSIPETRLRIGEVMRYADYGFRIDSRAVFYVEAKAANQDIDKPEYVFQAKRYAWSSMRAELAILTDFEEFRVYDARQRPDMDAPAQGELTAFRMSYKDYVANFDLLWKTFAKPAVAEGSLAALLKAADGKRQRITVDQAFLADLDTFRLDLGKDLHTRNPGLTEAELNEAAHHILNMLVFARILEDRDIEPTGRLRAVLNVWRARGEEQSLLSYLLDEFKRFRTRYRGIIFGSHSSQGLKVGDGVLEGIIEALYPPVSPYDFSAIPVPVLGKAYEHYLGRYLKLSEGEVSLAPKVEVRKAGGVFYTPEWIIGLILDRTLERKLKGRSAQALQELKLLDLACGSGAFTVKSASRLFRHARDWYTAHPEDIGTDDTKFPDAYTLYDGRLKLSVRKKAELVQQSLHCVDVDPVAAEITTMWLYILILEDEGSPILTAERKYKIPNREMPERVESFQLPDLGGNILVGNVLIGADLSDDPAERRQARVFDWERDSAKISKVVASGGFDVITSNPPYLSIIDMKKFIPKQYDYLRSHYRTMGRGRADLSYAFVEKGLELLKDDGWLGYIMSGGFVLNEAGAELRAVVAESGTLNELINFGVTPIFDDASPATAIPILHKGDNKTFRYAKIKNAERPWDVIELLSSEGERETEFGEVQSVKAAKLSGKKWAIPAPSDRAIFEAMERLPLRLKDVAEALTGVSTGADAVFMVEVLKRDGDKALIRSKQTKQDHWIEADVLRPLLRVRDIYRYRVPKNDIWIIMPHELDGSLILKGEFRAKWPLAWAYLEQNRERLVKRSEVKTKNWHRIIRISSPRLNGPKVITGWRTGKSQFTLDLASMVVTGGGQHGAIVPIEGGLPLEALLGVLNSEAVKAYIRTTSPQLWSGYAYSARILDNIPIAPLNEKTKAIYKEIADKVTAILATPSSKAAARYEADVDRLVLMLVKEF